MSVFILGGGPAGLAIADGLVKETGTDFTLIERAGSLGGLAQTVVWGQYGAHDLGPHKLFTLDQQLMARVEALLEPNGWLTRDKISTIFMNGHFLPYPPSPFSLAKVFGLARFIEILASYSLALAAGMIKDSEPKTFEADIKGRLGNALYGALFKPIALKLWGDPAQLDVKLSQSRVQTPKLTEVLGRMLGLNKKSSFEALTFRYPKGGLQCLWNSIHAKCKGRGQFLLKHTVERIEVADNRVQAIHCTNANGEVTTLPVTADDFVVSTLPLHPLVKMMGDAVSPQAVTLSNQIIIMNDLLLVFLHIDKASLFPESWIFVPDPTIAFHRVSEQESFDPGMTPNGSIICCEIMSNDSRPMSAQNDSQLVELCKSGLTAMGYSDFVVRNSRVIRLNKSYPVFRPGFQPALAMILSELDHIKNFRTIGRQGAFNYIGSLDAMDIGYGFANWYAKSESNSWQAERERTSHYPVLD